MTTTNVTRDLLVEFDDMLSPLAEVARSDDPLTALRRFLLSCGWRITTEIDPTSIVTGVTALVDAIDTAADGLDPGDLDAFLTALDGIHGLVTAVDGLIDLIGKGGPAAPTESQLTAFGEDVLHRLQVRWLSRKPVVGDLAMVIGLVQVVEVPAMTLGGWLERRAGQSSRLRPVAIVDFLADPPGYLRSVLVPNDWADSKDAAATNLFLAQQLNPFLTRLGGMWRTHADALATPADVRSVARKGIIEVSVPVADDDGRVTFGTELELFSAADTDDGGRPGPAVALAPFGGYEHQFSFGAWSLTLQAMVALGGVDAGDSRPALRIATSGIEVEPSVDACLEVGAQIDLATIIGGQGTRLELGGLDVNAFVGVQGGVGDVGFSIVAGSKLVLIAADFGDAVAMVAPFENTIEFDLGLQWSHRGGLRLAGSGSLELVVSQGIEIGGVVRLSGLRVRVDLADAIRLSAVIDAIVHLGPVVTAFEGLGLGLVILFPPEGGNLGPAAFTLRAEPPAGAAITIDAGTVTGSGFLVSDPVADQYAGGLQLQFEGLTLRAFGLLTTRLPDGSKGFSLLILVQASGFAPVPLGFGFTLTGVGGLLGVNRTVDVEVLRAGIRSRVLDSILFCNDDPAPRAAQIVSTLNSVFPPARDRYVFGPMVQLEWGTPALVTIEVALILELPSPLRLIVLGRLHALLPVADAAIVRLHLDAVGVLDFGRREASVDATLYDSFVGPFSLSGDMALRVSWGDQPEFALAVGGFHPAFKPPAGFPALRRLTLVLATGDNPRVRAEAYLAVTANTIQLGARLELRAEASGFVLEGGMGFDTLLTRVPFGFQVDIAAYLALKRGRSTIMGIDLRATLVGPNPWHLRGSVSFSILFLSVTIPIDATFGDTRQLPEVQQEPVWPELKQALEAPGNWAAELPADAGRLAVLSPAPARAGEVVVHPLGAVRVLQRVVPLERTIARFGAAPPQDYSRFSIREVVGAHRDSVVYDSFAPAQFLEMSDADKLSAPGFERMPAGVRLRAPEDASAFGSAASRPLRYETIAIGGPAAGTRFEPDAATIAQQAERGAAAGAATRTTGRAKFSVETPPPRVAEPAFDVTDVTHLTPKPDLTDGTYSAALEAAGLHRDVQVVRRAELAVP